MHHICCDGSSVAPLVDDLLALYRHHHVGASRPATPAVQFIDYAAFLARHHGTPAGERQESYWRSRLSDAVPLALPTDFDRTPVDQRRAATPRGFTCFEMHSVSDEVSGNVRDALHRIARETDSTLMIVLLAGLTASLHRLTRQSDICIQSTLSHRHHPALEKMIGMVANPVLVRTDVSAHPTFDSLVRGVASNVTTAFENAFTPILDWAPHSIRRVNFNYQFYQPSDASDTVEPDLRVLDLPLRLDNPKAPFDLHLWLFDQPDRISLRLLGNQALFRRETCQRILRGFVDLLGEI
jgi:hypothetical protein